nr:M12 family metallopeptidase [Oligoflexus tunisiensis]
MAILLSLFGCNAIESTSSSKGYYLSRWLWNKKEISVCFLRNPTMQDQERAIVKRLVDSTWHQHIDLRFTGWGYCDSKDADITIDMDNAIGGSSFVGSSSVGNKPSMYLQNLRNPSSRNIGYYEFGIVHEFGHALGIIHEHQRPDRPADEEIAGCRNGQTIHINGETFKEYDPNSIMNYCKQPYLPILSAGDIATIKHMYPRDN